MKPVWVIFFDKINSLLVIVWFLSGIVDSGFGLFIKPLSRRSLLFLISLGQEIKYLLIGYYMHKMNINCCRNWSVRFHWLLLVNFILLYWFEVSWFSSVIAQPAPWQRSHLSHAHLLAHITTVVITIPTQLLPQWRAAGVVSVPVIRDPRAPGRPWNL